MPASRSRTRRPPLPTAASLPTRFHGFHLRQYRADDALSEETEAFTAEIWWHDRRVGDASNRGRGGCDLVHVAPEARAAWEAAVAVLAAQPDMRLDGMPPFASAGVYGDDPLVPLLKSMAWADGERGRQGAPFGVLAHQWTAVHGAIHATAVVLMLRAPVADPLTLPAEYCRLAVLGADHQALWRFEAVPDTAPARGDADAR